MKSILFALCVILITNIVLGQEGTRAGFDIAKTNPDHPMKCWIEETQTAYSPGEKFIIKGSCRRATCTKQEDDTLILLYEGCALTRHQSQCKFVSKHPELEYPGCCPDLVC